LRIDTCAEPSVCGFLVAFADGAGGVEESPAGQAEAKGDERFLTELAEEFGGAGFVPEVAVERERVCVSFGDGELRRLECWVGWGLEITTYISSSNEEGMGSAPSTVEGMGACRDMMGGCVRLDAWWRGALSGVSTVLDLLELFRVLRSISPSMSWMAVGGADEIETNCLFRMWLGSVDARSTSISQ